MSFNLRIVLTAASRSSSPTVVVETLARVGLDVGAVSAWYLQLDACAVTAVGGPGAAAAGG